MGNYFATKYGDVKEQQPAQNENGQGGNYFATKYGDPQEAPTSQDESGFRPAGQINTSPNGYGSSVSNTANKFMAGVDLFNRQFEKMALGTMEAFGSKRASELKQTGGTFNVGQQGEAKAWDTFKDPMTGKYDDAAYMASGAGTVGSALAYGSTLGAGAGWAARGVSKLLPEMGKSIATFEAGHPIISNIGKGTALGSTMAGMDEADNMSQRGQKAAIGGLLGGAVPAVMGIAKGVGNAITGDIGHTGFLSRTMQPMQSAKIDLAERIKSGTGSVDEALGALDNAKQLMKDTGVNISPGEAFPNTAGVAEKVLKVSDKEKDALVAPRYFSEQKAALGKFNDIVEKMSPADANATKDTLFKSMQNEFVDSTGKIGDDATLAAVPEIITNNPILTDKYTQVLGAQSEAWKSLPKNSIAQLHKVKELIDDDLYKSMPNKAGIVEKSLSTDEQLALKESRKSITGILNQSPTYQAAMQVSQNQAIQKTYKNIMDAPKMPNMENDKTVQNMYESLFPEAKRNAAKDQFLKDVITTGGDPEQAQQVLNLLTKVNKSPLKNIVNVKSSGAANSRVYGVADTIATAIQKKTNGAYYKAVLDLTLSNNWADEVMSVLKAPAKSQVGQMGDLLMKAMRNTLGQVGAAVNKAIPVVGARQFVPSQQPRGYLPK